MATNGQEMFSSCIIYIHTILSLYKHAREGMRVLAVCGIIFSLIVMSHVLVCPGQGSSKIHARSWFPYIWS